MDSRPAPRLVVLAAGESRRLGEAKALVDLGGTSALVRLIRAGAALGGRTPLVVTGAHHGAIERATAEPRERGELVLIENPRWAAGRTGGLALAAASATDEDLCVAPVDVPLVPAQVFRALAEAWQGAGAPADGWLAPAYGAAGVLPRAGHPVVLGRRLALRLRELGPDVPLRELRAEAAPLWTIAVPFAEVLDDLDGPDDLARLRRRLAGA